MNGSAIKVLYRSCDGYREVKSFKTLDGARRFASRMVGDRPEIGGYHGYAVSGDGVGTIRVVSGPAKLVDLFPLLAAEGGA